eukprot:767785-Hanusia_phi.AAC.4
MSKSDRREVTTLCAPAVKHWLLGQRASSLTAPVTLLNFEPPKNEPSNATHPPPDTPSQPRRNSRATLPPCSCRAGRVEARRAGAGVRGGVHVVGTYGTALADSLLLPSTALTVEPGRARSTVDAGDIAGGRHVLRAGAGEARRHVLDAHSVTREGAAADFYGRVPRAGGGADGASLSGSWCTAPDLAANTRHDTGQVDKRHIAHRSPGPGCRSPCGRSPRSTVLPCNPSSLPASERPCRAKVGSRSRCWRTRTASKDTRNGRACVMWGKGGVVEGGAREKEDKKVRD